MRIFPMALLPNVLLTLSSEVFLSVRIPCKVHQRFGSCNRYCVTKFTIYLILILFFDCVFRLQMTHDRQNERPAAQSSVAINYDVILEHIGEIGKYSMLTFVPVCLVALFPGLVFMSSIFTTAIPNYRYHIVIYNLLS